LTWNVSQKTWVDLVHTDLNCWPNNLPSEDLDHFGGTYCVTDHNLLTSGRLRFLERNGESFSIELNSESEEGNLVNFLLEMKFAGIEVLCTDRDDLASVRSSLANLIDIENLIQGEIEFVRDMPEGSTFRAMHRCWFVPAIENTNV
jgi:hypothetical protein